MDKTTEIRRHRQPQPAELGHPAHTGESKATARRIDPRYAPLLAPAIMAIVISLAVSLVQTIVRLGFTPRLVPAWLSSFGVAVIIAVPTAVLVAPHVQRLVSRITGPPRRPGPPDAPIAEPDAAAGANSGYPTASTDRRSRVPSPDTATDDPTRTIST